MLPLYFFFPAAQMVEHNFPVGFFFLLDLQALFHLECYNKGGISWAGTDSSPWTSHMVIHMYLLAAWTHTCLCSLLADEGKYQSSGLGQKLSM